MDTGSRFQDVTSNLVGFWCGREVRITGQLTDSGHGRSGEKGELSDMQPKVVVAPARYSPMIIIVHVQGSFYDRAIEFCCLYRI